MDQWTLLGLIAGFLTTMGFVPQIIKGLKTRRLEDVSIGMLLLLCAGMFLWLVYGIFINSAPVMFWNAVAFTLNIILIGLKLRFDKSGIADKRV